MLPKKLFPFVNTPHIMMTVCGLRLYAQNLDPRTPWGASARVGVAARRLAGRATGNTMAATTTALPKAQGSFITFDTAAWQTPGSFPGCSDPVAINNAGEILGYSVDANGILHGLLRDSTGTFTSFDAPGAAAYSLVFFEGPPGSSLNPAGEATGGYVDATSLLHGFVRDAGGAITTFDAPSSVRKN